MENKRLGKNERNALEFISRCAGWHSFDSDRATLAVMRSLSRKGLIEVNEYGQFRKINVDNSTNPV